MIEAVERNNTAMTVSHTRRWMPIFHKARELVRDKTYGELKILTASMYYSRAMMFRNGTHIFDILCFLADARPEWLIAELEEGFDGFDRYRGDGGNEISSEPSANAYIKFANGVRAKSGRPMMAGSLNRLNRKRFTVAWSSGPPRLNSTTAMRRPPTPASTVPSLIARRSASGPAPHG